MFEEAGVAYNDTAHQRKGLDTVLKHIKPGFKDGQRPLALYRVRTDGLGS